MLNDHLTVPLTQKVKKCLYKLVTILFIKAPKGVADS